MSGWSFVDLLGFTAAALTLLTFSQKTMLPMRISAIGANVCFVLYGALGALYPVLVLHLILMPVNIKRLIDCCAMSHAYFGSAQSARPLIDEWRSGQRAS
jgi:hypothetical protein